MRPYIEHEHEHIPEPPVVSELSVPKIVTNVKEKESKESNMTHTDKNIDEGTDEGVEDDYDDSGLITIDPKFQKQLRNTLGIVTALSNIGQKNVTQPSRMQAIVEEKVWNVVGDVLDRSLGGGGGGTVGTPKNKYEFLSTPFAVEAAKAMFSRVPELVQAIGQQRAGRIIDAVSDKYLGADGGGSASGGNVAGVAGGEVAGGQGNSGGSEDEKQKDIILSLNSNNPEHVMTYATKMGWSLKQAKDILIMQQNDIKAERGMSQAAYNPPIPQSVETVQGQAVSQTGQAVAHDASVNEDVVKGISDMANSVGMLVDKMTSMEQELFALRNKVATIEGKKGKKEVSRFDSVDSDVSNSVNNTDVIEYEKKPEKKTKVKEEHVAPEVVKIDNKWEEESDASYVVDTVVPIESKLDTAVTVPNAVMPVESKLDNVPVVDIVTTEEPKVEEMPKKVDNMIVSTPIFEKKKDDILNVEKEDTKSDGSFWEEESLEDEQLDVDRNVDNDVDRNNVDDNDDSEVEIKNIEKTKKESVSKKDNIATVDNNDVVTVRFDNKHKYRCLLDDGRVIKMYDGKKYVNVENLDSGKVKFNNMEITPVEFESCKYIINEDKTIMLKGEKSEDD